jgi:hypothetical protein
MTVNTVNITSGPYTGNGLSDTYSYTFRVTDKTQLKIFETTDLGARTELVVDTDYTVAGIGNDAGGIITRVAGNLPTDYIWYIRSDYDDDQKTGFSSQGAFFPDIHEDVFDKRTFVSQQQQDILNRTFRLSDEIDIDGDFTIDADAANRSGKHLSFDSAGDLQVSVAPQLLTVDGIYDSVALMKVDSLATGLLIQTRGYYTAGDGGATYLIVAPQTFDGYGDHELANNNIAVLQGIGNPHAARYGAVFNGTTDDSLSLLSASESTNSVELPIGVTINTGTGTKFIGKLFHCFGLSPIIIGDSSLIVQNVRNVVIPKLSDYLTPSDWPSIVAAGWRPAFYNNMWAGAHWGGMPDSGEGEIAAGMLGASNSKANGSTISAGSVNNAVSVGKDTAITHSLLHLSKTGTPTGAITVTLNGQTGTLQAEDVGSDLSWHRVEFSTPPVLSAGVTYQLNVAFAGASIVWLKSFTARYPHGGDHNCVLIPQSSDAFLDPVGGAFKGRLNCFTGSKNSQGAALIKPLSDFIKGKVGTALVRGGAFQKDGVVLDLIKGIESNRITIRCDASTGFASVKIYEEDGSTVTLTGSTDVSVGDHDIGVKWRIEGDGADFITLVVNGAEEDTLIAQTFIFSDNFNDGHAWLGGGFRDAPAWSKITDMNVLPSADGWTWFGTATESTAMQVSGGVLAQNYEGYGANPGNYIINPSFNNATGWAVNVRVKVDKTDPNASGIVIDVKDGVKRISHRVTRSTIYTTNSTDTRSAELQPFAPHTRFIDILITGKGSDYYVYVNGELKIDGSGQMASAHASNEIGVGNFASSASASGGAHWDVVKYLNTGMITPDAYSNQIDEFAIFESGEADISQFYNSGSRISIGSNLHQPYLFDAGRAHIIDGVPSREITLTASLRNVGDGFYALEDSSHIRRGFSFIEDDTSFIYATYSDLVWAVMGFNVSPDETFATNPQYLAGASVGMIRASVQVGLAGTPGVVDPTTINSASGNFKLLGSMMVLF